MLTGIWDMGNSVRDCRLPTAPPWEPNQIVVAAARGVAPRVVIQSQKCVNKYFAIESHKISVMVAGPHPRTKEMECQQKQK